MIVRLQRHRLGQRIETGISSNCRRNCGCCFFQSSNERMSFKQPAVISSPLAASGLSHFVSLCRGFLGDEWQDAKARGCQWRKGRWPSLDGMINCFS